MSIKNVADVLVATLEQAGVKRIFGIVGDSLNGFTEALRSRGTIEWVHVRHEEVAAFAAAGEAQVTAQLAVCAGSCGPGNLHLINGLFDAHRSRVTGARYCGPDSLRRDRMRLFPGNASTGSYRGPSARRRPIMRFSPRMSAYLQSGLPAISK